MKERGQQETYSNNVTMHLKVHICNRIAVLSYFNIL